MINQEKNNKRTGKTVAAAVSQRQGRTIPATKRKYCNYNTWFQNQVKVKFCSEMENGVADVYFCSILIFKPLLAR